MSLTAEFNEESIKELIEKKPPKPIKLRRYIILVFSILYRQIKCKFINKTQYHIVIISAKVTKCKISFLG